MNDNSFIRFFVMLNENGKWREKGHTDISTPPSGYCKVESLNGRATFTLSIKNLVNGEYNAYILAKNINQPILMCEMTPGQDGIIYKTSETNANNIFSSGCGVNAVEAIHILLNREPVLSGYINRNITKSMQESIDARLLNLAPEVNKFEAATIDIDEVQSVNDMPEEIESSVTPLEVESINDDVENSTENINLNENTENSSEGNSSNFSSYVQTLARLYEGLVGGSKNGNKSDFVEKKTENTDCDNTVNEENSSYFSLVEGYYSELFSSGRNVCPFTYGKQNIKWVIVNPYVDSPCRTERLVGLLYEEGNVKYILDGMPVFANSCLMPSVNKNMIWLPSSPDCYGTVGYWVLFIDAKNGKIVAPDIAAIK